MTKKRESIKNQLKLNSISSFLDYLVLRFESFLANAELGVSALSKSKHKQKSDVSCTLPVVHFMYNDS